MNLVPAINQTREWRLKQPWFKTGRLNECENFQKDVIENILGISLVKTFDRLNLKTLELQKNPFPFSELDGLDWTETFDFYSPEMNFYFNCKFLCCVGGSNTRAIREVYHFINSQLTFLNNNPNLDITFINILDGNVCGIYMKYLQYLSTLPLYENVSHKIFIGDLYEFSLLYNI
jgi:hypothetical protein